VFDSLCQHVRCYDAEAAKEHAVVVERTTCLGHCTHAPVVAVNDDLYEDVHVSDLPDLFKELGI
jgi:NADH:ubiquinone oxidoreductase subunit E